jgi:O-antigen polymerase
LHIKININTFAIVICAFFIENNPYPKMKEALKPTIALLHLFLIAAMLSTSFMATQGFFNDLVISKQYGFERICLYTVFLVVITLLFQKQLQFTKIDLLVLLFTFWYVVNELFTDGNFTPINEILFNLLLWGLVYVFVRQASGNPLFVWGVAIVWMIVVLLQSALGLMQLYGLERSYHGLFSITGTFHNPGPFSGFVVSGLPLVLGVVGYTESKRSEVPRKRKNEGEGYTEGKGGNTERHRGIFLKGGNIYMSFSTIIRYSLLTLAWVTLLAILLVLPPAQSRAAWIAGIAGSLFVLAGHPSLLSFKDDLNKKFQNIKKSLRFLFLTVALLSIATAVYGLYSMKKDSADGRMLIWQVTGQLIKQSPVTGHGAGAFNALYMNEQATWFESGEGSEAQAMVAGSPEAPFNEPLKLWLEKGLIGFLLAGTILYLIFVNNIKAVNHKPKTPNPKLTTSFKGALISLLVFSLFSYPFDISSLTLQLVILVAIISAKSKIALVAKGKKSLLINLPVSIVLILATIHILPQRQAHYQAMKIWKKADQFYSYGSYHTAVEVYEEAFPVMKSEGLFLQMYGKALNMTEQYQKSNQILEMAQTRFSSQIIQNAMGDNYKSLGNYIAAEAAYEKSKQMIPSLLLPKYLMVKLYNQSGQNQKAQQAAEEILNSPVKVESSATREIMREMKKIINDQLPVNNDCY